MQDTLEIKAMRLHNPILVGGVNLGVFFETAKKPGLKITFITELDWYVVALNGSAEVIERSNVASFQPRDIADLGLDLEKPTLPKPIVTTEMRPQVMGSSRTAQVETPHSRPPRGPGRPPKMQGA